METAGSDKGWHGPNLNLNIAILLSGVFKKRQMDVAVSRKSVVRKRLKMDSFSLRPKLEFSSSSENGKIQQEQCH